MTDLAVIMSVYKNDRLAFLKKSVQSILDQTYRNFHYFIIFDGPVATDIDEYVTSLHDERINFFRLNENVGLATALNHLLEIVLKDQDIKYIARMDADDISMPTRFEKQRNFLLQNAEISIVGCWYEEIDEEGKHLSYRGLPTDHESLRKRYFTRTPFAHSSVTYRRELIKIAGFYPTDTVLMEDNVLWGRAFFQKLKFANIPEYLFKFRKDRDFNKRRSGLKYGWSYILSRFKIFKSLNISFIYYIIAVFIGVVKMVPLCSCSRDS
jgi:glycosyltransferase involved in cell wall biosynthesis